MVVLAVAAVLRLGWALAQPVTPAAIDRLPDQREYLELGRSLLAGRGLALFDPRFGQWVLAQRTPGYPVLIAACGGMPRIVRAIQALLGTSTVLAVYLLGRRLSGGRLGIGLAAAAIVAVNPFLIYFDGLLLSESAFTAALVWGAYLAVSQRVVLASVVLTAGVLVRPSGLVLAPVLVGVAAAVGRVNSKVGGAYDWRRALLAGFVAVLVLIAGLFPWAWRNHRVLGAWVWTTTNGGITLYDGFNPQATGASDQRFVTEEAGLRPIIREPELQRSRDLRARAVRWAAEHPSRLPGLTLRKMARTWSPVPLSGEFGRWSYVLISAMYAVPFDVLVVVGLCSRGLSGRVKWMLALPAIYFTAVHAMSVGSLRYRVPVEPVLAVLAGAGLVVVAGSDRSVAEVTY